MAEVMSIGYSLSTNDLEDMDKEVAELVVASFRCAG